MEVVRVAHEEDEGDKSNEKAEVDKDVAENIMCATIGVEDESAASQQGEVKDE